MNVLLLVDDLSYILSNCFQHQLKKSFDAHPDCNVTILSYMNMKAGLVKAKQFDRVVSVLKQRTLFNKIDEYAKFLGNTPLTIYDQDPWEAFRVGSPYLGAYQKFNEKLNIRKFCVTTKWWADYLNDVHKLPGVFVNMWVLPEYVEQGPLYDERNIDLGFIGQLHPYRKELFEKLSDMGSPVTLVQGSANYKQFLKSIQTMKVYVHSEDIPIELEDQNTNIGTGLWIKDVEACSQGAFSIRNKLEGQETYLSSMGVLTAYQYDSPEQIPEILKMINSMDSLERNVMINSTITAIKEFNLWRSTIRQLIS